MELSAAIVSRIQYPITNRIGLSFENEQFGEKFEDEKRHHVNNGFASHHFAALHEIRFTKKKRFYVWLFKADEGITQKKTDFLIIT